MPQSPRKQRSCRLGCKSFVYFCTWNQTNQGRELFQCIRDGCYNERGQQVGDRVDGLELCDLTYDGQGSHSPEQLWFAGRGEAGK